MNTSTSAVSRWQYLGVACALLSFVLLYPGISLPLMTVGAKINFMGLVEAEVFRETRSILQTVKELHHLGYTFIAGLIISFSVIIPVIKAVLLLIAVVVKRQWLWKLCAALSKWSMADVFVVASVIAFFSVQSTVELQAQLHEGFYWFLAYCLVNIAASHLLVIQRVNVETALLPKGSREAE